MSGADIPGLLTNVVVHLSVHLNSSLAGGSVNLVGEPPTLPPLTMAAKAESVASVTSQCSFSSTIVHVGDKKPPESGGHRQHITPFAGSPNLGDRQHPPSCCL